VTSFVCGRGVHWQRGEYDGDQHRTDRRQYVRDQTGLRKLAELGWIVIRVIAEDKPEHVVRRVRAALTRRGCRET
jgi:very-short-patch-repair endonuclease